MSLYCVSGPLWAVETLKFAIPDFPPFHIFPENGVPPEWVGQGKGDKMLTLYEKALPEFKFERTRMNSQRKEALFKAGANICASSQLLTAGRDKETYFTFTHFSPPRQLITSPETKLKLTMQNGAVTLKDLVNNPQLKGVYVLGRSYGPKLDPLLHALPKDGNLTELNSTNFGKNIIRMVALGRIDYVIDYSYNLRFMQAIDKRTAGLVTTPITEEGWEISMSGISCTRNKWGKSVIEKLDGIMPALIQTPSYRDLLEENLDDNEKKALREKIDGFYAFRGATGKTNIK